MKLTIYGWHPTMLNRLMGNRFKAARLKKGDRELVICYARQAGLPLAMGKRRVDLHLTLAPRQRAGDPDCYWKSLLDALVHAGMLQDDNRQWCEQGAVTFTRGKNLATDITLTEMEGAK